MKITLIMILFSLMNMAFADSAYANACHPKPLKLYWSADRTDNFSTATYRGENAAINAGYRYARMMGYVCENPGRGKIPLELYWNPQRRDNFTTASAIGEQSAINDGYRFVRIMGYVYEFPGRDRKPLKLYWSRQRHDNFTTATARGERDAINAGYRFVRVMGYIKRDRFSAPTMDPDQNGRFRQRYKFGE